jgi:hypothetical protein
VFRRHFTDTQILSIHNGMDPNDSNFKHILFAWKLLLTRRQLWIYFAQNHTPYLQYQSTTRRRYTETEHIFFVPVMSTNSTYTPSRRYSLTLNVLWYYNHTLSFYQAWIKVQISKQSVIRAIEATCSVICRHGLHGNGQSAPLPVLQSTTRIKLCYNTIDYHSRNSTKNI